MRKHAREIEDFPGYHVTLYGEVYGGVHADELTRSLNQRGHPTVGLMRAGVQFRRSVAPLVATAFLDPPTYHTEESIDRIIHLDGDLTNCQANNLMWRPLWFARKYQQERDYEPYPRWRRSFECIQTGEVFAHPQECAVRYGLLETDIHDSIMDDGTPVFPYNFGFIFIYTDTHA